MKALMIAIAGGLLLAPAAHAKKDKEEAAQEVELGAIEPTGVASFDEVFAEVTGIHQTLDRAEVQLDAANNRIAAAMGLSAGASTADALRQLADKAGGEVEVVMSGSVPTLQAADAVPEDITAAIEAINMAVTEVAGAADSLSGLPAQSTALIDEVKTFKMKLNPALLLESGIEATEMPQIARVTKANVQVAIGTPARVASVAEELAVFMDTVKNFGAEVSAE